MSQWLTSYILSAYELYLIEVEKGEASILKCKCNVTVVVVVVVPKECSVLKPLNRLMKLSFLSFQQTY